MSFYTELLNMQKVAKTESPNDFGTPEIPKMPKIDASIKLDAPKPNIPSVNFDPYGDTSKVPKLSDNTLKDISNFKPGSTGMAGVISSVGSSGSRRSMQP